MRAAKSSVAGRQDSMGVEDWLGVPGKALRTLLDHSSGILTIVDPSGRILYASRPVEGILGYEPARVLGSNIFDYVHPDDLMKARQVFEGGMTKPAEPAATELRCRHRDRGWRWISAVQTALLEVQGSVATVVSSRDITEQKRMEEDLRRSEQELQIQQDIAKAFLTVPDEEVYGKVLQVVLEMVQSPVGVFGYVDENGDLVAPSMTHGVWEKCRLRDKRMVILRPNWGDLWGRTLAGGKALCSNTALPVPEGHVPIQRALTVPILYHGRVIGLFAVANKESDYGAEECARLESVAEFVAPVLVAKLQRDWQERRCREAQEALIESARNYRLLAESTLDVITRHKARDGRISYVSPAVKSLLGFRPAELLDHDVFERVHPEDLLHVQRARQAALGAGGIAHLQFRMKHKRGHYVWVETSSTVVPALASGQPAEVVSVTRDITERKRVEQELEESREQLRQLAARLESAREQERTKMAREIHDELGQTLTGLKMQLQSLVAKLSRKSEPRPGEVGERLAEIADQVDVTIQTVKRISTELRPGVLDHLGLAAAIEWQAQEFKVKTGIGCRISGLREDVPLGIDVSTVIFRIFQEVLTNITRHANATAVRIRMKLTARWLTLTISDNGRGLEAERVTDPKSLGLLGMRERARLIGGSVLFQRRREAGTAVTLRVPVGRPMARTASRRSESAAEVRTAGA